MPICDRDYLLFRMCLSKGVESVVVLVEGLNEDEIVNVKERLEI